MTKNAIANKCDYDFQNDSIFFYIKGKKYMSSVEFDGIVLDFNEGYDLINLEILNASEKFHVSKSDILNIKDFNAHIEIDKESIKVDMKLVILKRNKLFPSIIEALTTPNILNLPAGTQAMAVTC